MPCAPHTRKCLYYNLFSSQVSQFFSCMSAFKVSFHSWDWVIMIIRQSTSRLKPNSWKRSHQQIMQISTNLQMLSFQEDPVLWRLTCNNFSWVTPSYLTIDLILLKRNSGLNNLHCTLSQSSTDHLWAVCWSKPQVFPCCKCLCQSLLPKTALIKLNMDGIWHQMLKSNAFKIAQNTETFHEEHFHTQCEWVWD